MPTDHVAQPWALRSTLIAVSDLERSVAFYQAIGPFDEIAREDAVVVLGESSATVDCPDPARDCGVIRGRSWPAITGSPVDDLQRRIARRTRSESRPCCGTMISSRSRQRNRRWRIGTHTRGRDPDNLPLVFVCYDDTKTFGPTTTRQSPICSIRSTSDARPPSDTAARSTAHTSRRSSQPSTRVHGGSVLPAS